MYLPAALLLHGCVWQGREPLHNCLSGTGPGHHPDHDIYPGHHGNTGPLLWPQLREDKTVTWSIIIEISGGGTDGGKWCGGVWVAGGWPRLVRL